MKAASIRKEVERILTLELTGSGYREDFLRPHH